MGTESDALFGAETEPERYQLVQELASGGMATVFLARTHNAAGAPQLVAVKRIHRHLAREQSFLEMFFDEARIAAQIQHPNVCALHDFGRSGAVFYIAMEYVLGETLYELLRVLARDRRLRESLQWQIFAATIVADACDGLQAVHELTDENGRPMHVVHRDISPGNIFVTYEGGVKVVDFGIAYAQNKMHHTQTGTLKGKLGYMPPELIAGDGRDVDRRADIWALGVCLWELLAGSLLFGGHNDAATMFNVMQRAIPSLLTVAGAPARLDDIVIRALDRDRNGRYPTAQALARDLRDWIASTGQPVGSDELAEFMQTRFAPQYARKLEVIEEAQTATGAVGLGILIEDQITRQLPIRSPSWPRVDSAELMRPAGSADALPVRVATSPPPRPPSADPFSLTVPADAFAVPVASDPGPAMSAVPSMPPLPDRRRRRWPAYSVANRRDGARGRRHRSRALVPAGQRHGRRRARRRRAEPARRTARARRREPGPAVCSAHRAGRCRGRGVRRAAARTLRRATGQPGDARGACRALGAEESTEQQRVREGGRKALSLEPTQARRSPPGEGRAGPGSARTGGLLPPPTRKRRPPNRPRSPRKNRSRRSRSLLRPSLPHPGQHRRSLQSGPVLWPRP